MFNKQVQELNRLYEVQKSFMKSDPNYTRCDFFPMQTTFTQNHSVGPTRFLLDQDFDCKSCDYYDLDREEINLSLSIGRNSNKILGTRKPWKNNIVYPSSQTIIDLEESTETGSCSFLKNAANLQQDYFKNQESSMNGGMHQEWIPTNQGSNGWHEVKQTVLMDLDLNKSQPDESSFQSDEPLVGPYPSSDGSYGESCSQITTSLTFNSQANTRESQTKIYTIDLESLPEPSSDLTEEKEIQNEEKEIQKGAFSLISISQQQTSTSNQDSETKIESNKKKMLRRSSSIDSYELLVLQLEESSDYATSKAFEITEFNKKDNGIKLKRGRRIKDFQKEILPAISSLSKQEIWEDMKLLKGVIKSREYKRLNKVKTGNVKSKRSKVNCVSQKKKK